MLPNPYRYDTMTVNNRELVSTMNHKQNLHIHTTYADGKDTPEQIIREALKCGFDSIGFSEHSYTVYSDYPHQMTVAGMADYMAEIRALKEQYRGKIDVFCGLEFEFFSDIPLDGFDYLIGSVHYLDIGGKIVTFDRNLEQTLAYLQDYFGGDSLAFARKYYETVANLPEKGKFDILGHFDLLTKNNEQGRFMDTTSKAYLALGYEAIHALQGRIPLFEVNTGAIARGYRTAPYPQMEFLREFYGCGFGTVITSDCHDRNTIDCYFEEARLLLAEAGFTSRWILTDSGFKEVAL